jgi:hypothetical protein
MLPPHGQTQSEHWVAMGRLAATRDLLTRLQKTGKYAPIYVLAADERDTQILVSEGAHRHKTDLQEFHFGQVLAEFCENYGFNKLAYFGGASAPLLKSDAMFDLAHKLAAASRPQAIVNNLYSTDWFLTNEVSLLGKFKERLPVDNPFGWVYAEEVGVDVLSEAPSASTRADLDTPIDFAMLIDHPNVGKDLEEFLKGVPEDLQIRVDKLRTVVKTPASRLTIIGRLSSYLWRQLDTQTQIWVRVLSEERGMVASRRVERGEVRSLISPLIRHLGPDGFIKLLGELSDAVLWDTRVWMTAEIGWPDASERFAFDLGDLEGIKHKSLQELAKALKSSEYPILAGGYGVVSGGLYTLLETIEGEF